MENATRPNGDSFTRAKDGAPDWIRELCMAAHEPSSSMPCDDIYGWLPGLLEAIADGAEDDMAETVDSLVDVYSNDLAAWLGRGNAGYCDEATETGLVSADASMDARMMAGQYMAIDEVASALVHYLREKADDEDDTGDES